MMCREQKPWHPLLSFAMFAVVVFVYLGSYLIAFENVYAFESNVTETYAASDDGFYAIRKADGTYDVYYHGAFLENAESLEYYPDIPIFTK